MPSATQSPDHLLNRRPQRADAALSRPKYWHPRLSPGPRCTVPTSQISIAPADRGARSPEGFLHWRLSNAGPATLLCVDSSVMGPASETRHTRRLMHRSKKERLLYRIIGAQQDRLRDGDPQRLGSLEVDGELKLARLPDMQFRRFCTLQQP